MKNQKLEESEGYKSLLKSVMADCKEGEDCFNKEGCDKQAHRYEKGKCYINIKCTHRYCNTFKWVIDRVKHYAKKTGLSEEEILDTWEKQRSYWYLNYYQESNQPLIEGDNVRVFETKDEFQKSLQGLGFRCPKCNHTSMKHNECDSNKCDWKSYGLFGTLGKGITVFIKEQLIMTEMFMPVAWEKQEEGVKQ